MLTSLKIENIAIIEKSEIEFSGGFNVLTGETGAGKSIIIDSINAVLGERTSRELIRTGCEQAKVCATFYDVSKKVCDIALPMGINCDDDVLIISRIIKNDGKNICSVNGTPVTVSMLKKIGSELINIYGQHDSQSLLDPEKHCSFIDVFGELSEDKKIYEAAFKNMCKIKEQLDALNINESEKLRKIEMLEFEIDELEKADLHIGEKEDLTRKKNLYKNSQTILRCLNSASELLGSENCGYDLISQASNELNKASQYYDGISATADKITDMRFEIESCMDEIRDTLSELDYNESELDDIEERLDLLYRLSRKYGETEEDMLSFLEKSKQELDNIGFSEQKTEQLKKQLAAYEKETIKAARNLSDKRSAAGKRLSDEISKELKFLDMPDVRFEIKHEECAPGINGIDKIEFLISANIGEDPKPLAKIASGGELSRIMLAIKTVFSGKDSIYTLIFDEIDSGVSGKAAEKIAIKLKNLSHGRQVICITHLASIAAAGNRHMLISKSVSNNKTFTAVDVLNNENRKYEIARIMGGSETTQTSLMAAEELIEKANTY